MKGRTSLRPAFLNRLDMADAWYRGSLRLLALSSDRSETIGPPPFSNREAGADTFFSFYIFVVVTGRLSGLHRNGFAGTLQQLLGRFVKTDGGDIAIARHLVDIEHVFHGGHEGAVLGRRNDPLLF